jgi:hypothetical protein
MKNFEKCVGRVWPLTPVGWFAYVLRSNLGFYRTLIAERLYDSQRGVDGRNQIDLNTTSPIRKPQHPEFWPEGQHIYGWASHQSSARRAWQLPPAHFAVNPLSVRLVPSFQRGTFLQPVHFWLRRAIPTS